MIVNCDRGKNLCLDEAIRNSWHDETTTMSDEAARTWAIARMVDVDVDILNLVSDDDGVYAKHRSRTIAKWDKDPTVIADEAGCRFCVRNSEL